MESYRQDLASTNLFLRNVFRERFGREPEVIARAPGRVNLIGEHTDYNEGFVLPLAIDRWVYCAMARTTTSRIELISLQQEPTCSLPTDGIQQQRTWCDYPLGVLVQLPGLLKAAGIQALFWSNVPIGSGLSSSAALEVATLTAVSALFGHPLNPNKRIEIAHRAETEFVGMRCGIMDQFVAVKARKNHALFIDCRSLTGEPKPLDLPGHAILIIDTQKPHALVDSAYHERRRQCDEAVALLKTHYPDIRSLRDVSTHQLEAVRQDLPDLLWRRAYHVVTENQRVLATVDALKWKNLQALGSLMLSSHLSLKDYYEVSCPELDFLVDRVMMEEGSLGARLTGAGFGGCTVNLVLKEKAHSIFERVASRYRERFGLQARKLLVQPAAGARVVWRRTWRQAAS